MLAADKIQATKWMLRRDSSAFFAAAGKSVRAFAKGADVDEKLVRQIGSTDWDPSLRTLLKIEAGYRTDPAWPTRIATESQETYDRTGFIVRREFDHVAAACFPDEVMLWSQAVAGSAAAYDELRSRPHVSVIDVSNSDPHDYVVEHHAEVTRSVSGVSKEGRRLGDLDENAYRSAQLRDYLAAKHMGRPLAQDIVWYAKAEDFGRIYRRLLLPLSTAHRLLSIVTIYVSSLSGSDAYSRSISSRDM